MKKDNTDPTLIKTIYIIMILTIIVSCSNENINTGIFTESTDVGSPALKGSAVYIEDKDEYHLSGAGENMWFGRDEFQFLWTKTEGDFILTARVKFEGEGVNPHRKIGIMARETLDAGSAHVNGVIHDDGLTSLQYRPAKNDNTEEIISPNTAPNIIQLVRKGNTYKLSTASEGETFTCIELENFDLENELYIGLFICSHETDVIEKAVFDNVRLSIPAKDDFVPYRDYIGSHIEIMDIESGKRRIVHSSPLSLQAPNWSPDGKKLIYNSEGKIFAFDIATGKVEEVYTGFAVNNNNDHVLSFDGKLMGLSDHTEHPENQSLVYVIPSTGGEPELITKDAPSYLHGFSPDGEFMVYTAGRDGNENLDIYKISRLTKEEVRLTNSSGLDDGSEYSPDGQYIYFNSSRTGTMQVWRMKPDGSQQEQLTFDEYNDWFPHVSPDGKWLVFISYSSEIDANDHPFYKHVYIRLMPSNGGKPKTIAYLYGGQGSMNVFNWSPDSRKIAFVSNTQID